MYRPDAFREDDPEILARLIDGNSFATVISLDQNGMVASHLPLLLDRSRGPHGAMRGHMARANQQWKAFDGNTEVLVIFQAPHAYISPTWYETQASVPTWNYAVVHAHGAPHLLTEAAEVRDLLEQTIQKHESPFENPWSLDRLDPEFIASLATQIVAFEIPIARIEGKLKLSQNRPMNDRLAAIAGLRRQATPNSLAIAAAMEASLGREESSEEHQ